MNKFRYILFLLLFTWISVSAQTPLLIKELPLGNTPAGYNEDTLKMWVVKYLHGGGGIVDTNSIKFIGDHRACGLFGNGTDIGIYAGMILSNGKVTSAAGPNSSGFKGDSLGTPGDEDLLSMYNLLFATMGAGRVNIDTTGDAAVLEFYYKPFGEEIVLDYSFASEEYYYNKQPDVDLTGFPTTTSQTPDFFAISVERAGFFENSALVPVTTPVPPPKPERWVNVVTVNPNTLFSGHFVSNPTPPPNSQQLGTQFDGFTKKTGNQDPIYIRRRDLVPCTNYKVKIAIEDFWMEAPYPVKGFKVNSAVFLKAQSLRGGANHPGWKTTYEFTNPNPDFSGCLIEGGCNNIEVTFTLDEPAPGDYYIPFRVLADANRNKIRVSNLATGMVITEDSIRFIQDETEITILLEAINLTADVPNVTFQYATNPCEGRPTPFGGPIYSGRIPMTLRNNDPFTFTQNPKTYQAYCKETLDITITDITQGGVTPINFLWNWQLPAMDTLSYQVNASPDFVTVNVGDGCGNDSTIQVKIINKPIVLELVLDAFLCGPGQSIVIQINAETPSFSDYTIDHVRWYKLPGNTPLGNQNGNEITVVYDDVVGADLWTCGFEITDVCGGTQTGSFLVNQSELTLGSDVWICNGESKTLTANAQAQQFEWYATNNPGVILSTTNNVTVSPSVTTEYALRILDLCNHIQTATITVNVDLFVLAITIDPASAEICPGTTITLTANDAESWEWQPGGQTTQTIILNPVTPDTYTYTLNASSLYCIDKEATQSFTVFPIPSANFLFTPPSEACTGEEISFTYGGGTPDTLIWDFGDGTTSRLQNPTHAYTNAGIYDISLHVDQYICSNDTIIQISIDPLPVPDFQADLLEGCLPVTVQFTDFTLDAFPNATYVWDFGDGSSSSLKNPQHEYTAAGLFSVSLSVNNTDRCAGSILHSNLIQVNPNPEANATADPYLTTLDTPEINFFNQSISDSTIQYYIWTFGDGDTSHLENPSHIYQAAGDYTVQLFIETVNGCLGDTTLYVALTEEVRLFIPNAFTPNGDGLNDVFEIKGTPVADFNLYIFDRWGGQIFSTHNYEEKWDGNNTAGDPVPAGTYVYQISGTDYLLRPLSFKGIVTVVR